MVYAVKTLVLGLALSVGVGFAVEIPSAVPAVETNKPQPVLMDEQKKALVTEQEKWRYLCRKLDFKTSELELWQLDLIGGVGQIINMVKYPVTFGVACYFIALMPILLVNNKDAFTVSLFLDPAVTYVVYLLMKKIGDFLENQSIEAKYVLTSFLRAWPTVHREQSPQALYEIFDALYANMQAHKGQITSIDDEKAQALIESILAVALVVESITVSVNLPSTVNAQLPRLTKEQKKAFFAVEKAKCHYLREKLDFEMSRLKSWSRTTGKIINGLKYSVVFAAACWFFLSGSMLLLFHQNEFVPALFKIPLVTMSVFFLMKNLGNFFENQPIDAKYALTNFLNAWPTAHREQTPQAFREIFDNLYANMQANNGELTSIDDEQVQSLIENVEAMAMAVESI